MKTQATVHAADVQTVYSGPEGDLWELIMGQQIHIGGFASSMDLAERARVPAGARGVDLCCCNGAGMRFLLRFRNLAHMTGVDFTPRRSAAAMAPPRRSTPRSQRSAAGRTPLPIHSDQAFAGSSLLRMRAACC